MYPLDALRNSGELFRFQSDACFWYTLALPHCPLNRINENQHYVSRVLLERFRSPGSPLFRYSLGEKSWSERSVANLCSATGYNQWLESGVADNTFESCFSQVESLLPKTLRAIDACANTGDTVLEAHLYENLCRYCTMLKLSSPAAKAGAVASLTIQLNFEVENDHRSLLRDLDVPEDLIREWKVSLANGYRIILDCDNPAQFAFRLQYSRTCDITFAEFLRCQWTLLISPTELPIADIGLIPIYWDGPKLNQYLLPISPNHLLMGIHYFDQNRNSRNPVLRNHRLTPRDAGQYIRTICSSAMEYVIAKWKDPRIESAVRSSDSTVGFTRVTDVKGIKGCGMQHSDGSFRLKIVPTAEYVRFVHSFVTPPPQGTQTLP